MTKVGGGEAGRGAWSVVAYGLAGAAASSALSFAPQRDSDRRHITYSNTVATACCRYGTTHTRGLLERTREATNVGGERSLSKNCTAQRTSGC